MLWLFNLPDQKVKLKAIHRSRARNQILDHKEEEALASMYVTRICQYILLGPLSHLKKKSLFDNS